MSCWSVFTCRIGLDIYAVHITLLKCNTVHGHARLLKSTPGTHLLKLWVVDRRRTLWGLALDDGLELIAAGRVEWVEAREEGVHHASRAVDVTLRTITPTIRHHLGRHRRQRPVVVLALDGLAMLDAAGAVDGGWGAS